MAASTVIGLGSPESTAEYEDEAVDHGGIGDTGVVNDAAIADAEYAHVT